MDERRSVTRRQIDRELAELIEKKTGVKPAQLVRERKLRQAIRHTCKAVLQVEVSHSPGDSEYTTTDSQSLRGRVLDLSLGGVFLFTKYELKPGAQFKVGVKIYDGSTIEALAEVRWSKYKEAKGGYATGAEFISIDEKNQQRLQTFLSELDATLGM